MNKMIRICPVCNSEVIYKNKISFWKSKKLNKPCVKCTRKEVSNRPEEKIKNSNRQIGKRMGQDNHFYNKKHTEETKERIRRNAKVLKGVDNPMFGKSFYDIWVDKFGKKIADEKLLIFKMKKSIKMRGKLNIMYGKPSPNGSGNGWSGWYKGWHFRSISELSYVINVIERFKMNWSSAEYIRIPYLDYKGSKRTYSPDFIINNKYLVECKPKKLIGSTIVRIKSEAASEYCRQNNMIYKIVSPAKLSIEKIKSLYLNSEIKFTKRYEEKAKLFLNLN